MKKPAFTVVSGIILLGFGITGLALMHTNLIYPPSSSVSQNLPEQNLPQNSSENNQRAAVEEKLPPIAETTPTPGRQTPNYDKSAQNGQEDQVNAEKPVPVPQLGKGARRYPDQNQSVLPPLSSRKSMAKKAPATPGVESRGSRSHAKEAASPARQAVTMRISLDPVRNTHIRLARVHSGDRVTIRIRRIGDPRGRVYLAFNIYDDLLRRRYDFGTPSGALVTPVRDDDHLTLRASNQFGPELSRRLDSKDGAILELGTVYDRYRYPYFQQSAFEQGRFDIEIRIYTDNRWNIRPRSFL